MNSIDAVWRTDGRVVLAGKTRSTEPPGPLAYQDV